jgi:hypothetical protein
MLLRRAGKARDATPAPARPPTPPAAPVSPKNNKAGPLILAALFGVLLLLTLLATNLKAASTRRSETPLARDVLLSSFPKSGSYWLRFLLANTHGLLSRDPLISVDFNTIEMLIPDLELGDNRKNFLANAGTANNREIRYFKSHQPYVSSTSPTVAGFSERPSSSFSCIDAVGPGMEEHQCNCPNCPARWKRAVLVVRDYRNTMCSYYHFMKNLKLLDSYDADHDEGDNFRAFLASPEAAYGYDHSSWLKSWLVAESTGEVRFAGASWDGFDRIQRSATPGFHNENTTETYVVRYEDLKEDAAAVVKGLVEFLYSDRYRYSDGRSGVADSIVQLAVKKSSFDAMRQKEKESNGGVLFKKLHDATVEGGFSIVRDGKDTLKGCDFGEEEDGRRERGVYEAFGYAY